MPGAASVLTMDVLDPARVDDAVAGGLGWERQGSELVKVHMGRDFADALSYVNEVGAVVEQAAHHPDSMIQWNTVTLRLSTHSAGGITNLDLDLARRIDALGAGH